METAGSRSGRAGLHPAGIVSRSAGGFNFVLDVVERHARERPSDEALRAIAA